MALLTGLTRWMLAIAIATVGVTGQETGNHPDWPRWCGKVYQPGYPSFDPGGQTVEPSISPNAPLLNVQFKPRYSLYLSSEKQGQFIVNAALSPYHGQHPWSNTSSPDNKLVFSINLAETDDILVEATVTANTTANLFTFDLTRLQPRNTAIPVVLYGAPVGGSPSWTATSELWYLPTKTNGSVTRLDNLHGGLHFLSAATNHTFAPFLPYGFYASYDGFLALPNVTAEIQKYANYGLNAMTPLTLYRDDAAAFGVMDGLDLRFMYDLRDGYQNRTYVTEQARAARDGGAMFAYWSADEPDGHQDAFNGTGLARGWIRGVDPYHPVAVVLNCQDYYFGPYTTGADIIMEDVYPIGINSTFSKWGTACNATLGDCGCDNCQGNVQDVSRRLDDLARYERWLGLWPKTKIHNPQSFYGEGYWGRYPTPEEEYVMSLLAFNHGAQGIISWVYPTTELLGETHGRLAKVVTGRPVVEFLVGGDGPYRADVEVQGSEVVDAAYWVVGKQMLVSVVNGGYEDTQGPVQVSVPNAIGVSSVQWGDVTWTLANSQLSVPVLSAMGTSMVILDLLKT